MNRTYEHVLAFALSHPWNLDPGMLALMAGVLARRVAGLDVEQASIEAALVNRKNLPQPRRGSVAVIPVYGVIAPRMNQMTNLSGGTSYEQLTGQLRAAVSDPAIRNILLDVDSQGGSAAGNMEFAAEVMKARAKKPVIAVAKYTMGSAAYMLSAGATEIVAEPSAHIGSIGTYTIHNDLSKALEQLGIKRTFISAGEGKVDGNETEPLSEAYQARIQAMVNDAFGNFVDAVVKGRGQGVTASRVKSEWKAHVYSAGEAKSIGMIDRVATLDDTLSRLLSDSPDAADHAAATLIGSPATDQELPEAATSQELAADAQFANTIESEWFALGI